MKKLLTIALIGVALIGCKEKIQVTADDSLIKFRNGGVEQYVIDDKICTQIWWHEKAPWAKYREINTPKDTLRKDSLEAERIYKTIKSLK